MRILGIGVAALDIVNLVAEYPAEDAEVRALSQRSSLGGNAANTLTVLSQLGHSCRWAGALADEANSEHILSELNRRGIDTSACVRHAGTKAPTSYVCLSRATGSRTIVHFRDLPEYSARAFEDIDLRPLDWVHFEGRDPDQTGAMLRRVRRERPELGCSLEVEKPRQGIEALFDLPQVLLFSRGLARSRGYLHPEPFLRSARGVARRPLLVCAWGEEGAAALDAEGSFWSSPAFPPQRVVDTLGAGDVLNAGVVHARLQGMSVATTLEFACRLAGRKCGQLGLEGLEPGSADG